MGIDLSLLDLFMHASLLVKGVMVVLLAFSISSWALILQRGYALYRAHRLFSRFQKQFDLKGDLKRLSDHLVTRRAKVRGIEQVLRVGFREFVRLYKQQVLPQVVMEGVTRTLRVALAKQEQILERSLPFLATVGAISVYIGLLGTVWGIMTAFQALGVAQQATLAMVAPGISEALIATALGLFAAIPAVFAYNRYAHQVQSILRNYDNLAEEFSQALYRRLHSPQQDAASFLSQPGAGGEHAK